MGILVSCRGLQLAALGTNHQQVKAACQVKTWGNSAMYGKRQLHIQS